MDNNNDGPARLITEHDVVVCCGSGGVGKTTVAAAIALDAARRGLRACVVTIDPAKRLADALGIGTLSNTPRRIEGSWPGELWAMMLDTKGTFDDLVTRYAATPAQADAILANRLYRNISSALSGTQEYMAMEKLYELHHGGPWASGARRARAGDTSEPPFDIVVVDTPPNRNALDFLDAPRRLTSFLDNRIFRLVVMPTRAYLRAVSAATKAFLRTVSRVVGSEVVGDAIAFFNAFEGMEDGFRQRAGAVRELLSDERTAFVLVTSPRPDAVEDATFFAERLTEAGLGVDALVVNRVHPRFAPATPLASGTEAGALAPFVENMAQFEALASAEERHFGALARRVAPGPVQLVPLLAGDVHDLDGLAKVADCLFEN